MREKRVTPHIIEQKDVCRKIKCMKEKNYVYMLGYHHHQPFFIINSACYIIRVFFLLCFNSSVWTVWSGGNYRGKCQSKQVGCLITVIWSRASWIKRRIRIFCTCLRNEGIYIHKNVMRNLWKWWWWWLYLSVIGHWPRCKDNAAYDTRQMMMNTVTKKTMLSLF